MFSEVQWQRYADVMIWGMRKARSGRFKTGEIVLLRFNIGALKLAEVLQARLLSAGLNPVLRMSPTANMEQDFYKLSRPRQLTFVAPGEETLLEAANGSIFLQAPESITHLKTVDPQKIAKMTLSRKPLRDILRARDERGLFGWSLCMVPTAALAEHAGISLESYVKQVINACFLNRKDPVSHWQRIYEQATRIKKRLDRMQIDRLHVESRNIDLHVQIGSQRRWLGMSGHNIPSFEIFISPDWRGTKGVYQADQPSFRSGNLVRNVRLEFKKGLVVDVRADAGANFVRRQLSMDKGASRIGEFSLTDKRFSRINQFMANTLYDENYGGRYGNCHVALGSAYTESFRGNAADLTPAQKKSLGFNDSALHWDLVNTVKKRVTAITVKGDRRVIYENGQFTL